MVRYGPGSDWVRNILMAGTAMLRVDGREHRLESPRLVSQQEAVNELIACSGRGADFFKAEHCLLMNHSSENERDGPIKCDLRYGRLRSRTVEKSESMWKPPLAEREEV